MKRNKTVTRLILLALLSLQACTNFNPGKTECHTRLLPMAKIGYNNVDIDVSNENDTNKVLHSQGKLEIDGAKVNVKCKY